MFNLETVIGRSEDDLSTSQRARLLKAAKRRSKAAITKMEEAIEKSEEDIDELGVEFSNATTTNEINELVDRYYTLQSNLTVKQNKLKAGKLAHKELTAV